MSCHQSWTRFASALLVTALVWCCPFQTFAQTVGISVGLSEVRIAFSNDGSVLYVVGISPVASDTQHVEAITYDARTGTPLHHVDFAHGTTILSMTSDGRNAIITTSSQGHTVLSVVNTDTGKAEPVPVAWYDTKSDDPDARLSRDGRLLSVYSETGSADRPMVVTVYDWRTKAVVTKQMSAFTAAGGGFDGGITPNGQAMEFDSGRAGPKLTDLKTGRVIASFGRDSVLSPDGRWVVELPDLSFQDAAAPRQVLIKDGKSGAVRGRIDVPVPDDVAYGQMSGAFCGDTGHFVLAGGHALGVYAIPSGTLLENFPIDWWRDPAARDPNRATVACSADAHRIAILSGTRLTLDTLKLTGGLQLDRVQ